MADTPTPAQSDDIQFTVTSKHITNTPDLQMRLWLRACLLDEQWSCISPEEKFEIMINEANRYIKSHPKVTTTPEAT